MNSGALKIISPGFYTSIQDSGRFGYKKFGVPVSGAMDFYAFKMANLLLGNQLEAPVLEITLLGPELQFLNATTVCFCGGKFELLLNNKPVPRVEAFAVKRGDVLKIGKSNLGFRGYLSVKGGFKAETVFGSSSMYAGLTRQFRIEKGECLNFQETLTRFSQYSSVKFMDQYLKTMQIDAYEGPEFSMLNNDQQQQIFKKPFLIDPSGNRMAFALSGTIENNLPGISSVPVMPGTVQLTPSGKLIILGKDCQTTGGYPRILQLSEEAMNVIAQKMPKESIQFRRKDYA